MGNVQFRPQPDLETARKTMADVNTSLKPFRPPTAPSSDLEIERKAIRKSQPSFVYVQLALFVLLAVMVVYLVFPASVANGVSVLLLVVGIAAGFFLRK
jgi:hypothetical protein